MESRTAPRIRLLTLALIGSVLVWIIAWHGDAAFRMVRIWWRSETFAHGLVIYPVSLWLIWRKREELAALPVIPSFRALLPFAGAALLALLGEVGGVEAVRQLGLVTMVALAVVALAGSAISRAILFPLAFTLLAVPIGDFLLPTLMNHTADFTVAALRLSGVPVYREGLYFTVPTGRWSVIEACSGLRYLIASVTLGLLFAYLTYRTFWRRALFVLASIVVPIVANWIRAYMIVMIGHLSDMRLAVGVDHLLYGWVFFGIVMLLLFWIGSGWREDLKPLPNRAAAPAQPARNEGFAFALVLVALGLAALAAAGPLVVGRLDAKAAQFRGTLADPRIEGGWREVPSRLPAFVPHFRKARGTIQQAYERDGRQVGLFVAFYAQQTEDAELISYNNRLVVTQDRTWRKLREGRIDANGARPAVLETLLRSPGHDLRAWQWYWADGEWTVRPEEVKLRQALGRLTGRGDGAAVVIVYTERTPGPRDESARLLQEFVAAATPSIEAALQTARGSPDAAGLAQAQPAPRSR